MYSRTFPALIDLDPTLSYFHIDDTPEVTHTVPEADQDRAFVDAYCRAYPDVDSLVLE